MFNVRLDIQAAFFLTLGINVTMIQYRNFLLSLSVLMLCFCGCPSSDGNIGWVEGVVTLDGEPVDGATVRYYPASGERGSSGKTDSNGYYELRYTRSEQGAVVGEHKVTISTEVEADGYGQKNAPAARAESIPKKYLDRKNTELTATVASGSNTFNFELTSEK